MANYCAGKATNLVATDHLGHDSLKLRLRRFGPGVGAVSSFGGVHWVNVERNFLSGLHAWAMNLNHWMATHTSSSGPKEIAWFGDVGTMACHRPTAAHNRARGLDLCHIRFKDGTWVDMNYSHQASMQHKRLYLAVAANLRRFFGTVLTTHYNAAHRDHIHVDDLTAVQHIRTNKRTDTTLVQSAANLLLAEGLVIDGAWGSRTQAAFEKLVTAFGLECTDPLGSTDHADLFLSYVVRTATANRGAGAFRSNVCDPCASPDGLLAQLDCDLDDLLGGIG